MIMLKRIYQRVRSARTDRVIQNLKQLGAIDPGDLSRDKWSDSTTDPLAFYLKCFRYFHAQFPKALREHREYFTVDGRGFGEDAFHVMWYLLHKEFNLRNFLEIGVYRGQTLSLISLLQRTDHIDGTITGISPFCSAGDAVSQYRDQIDYLEDTRCNFRAFSLPEPKLVTAYSTDPEALSVLRSCSWDCIYIDGNHDYEVASIDWVNAAAAVRTGGLIVLDDSALSTQFAPPPFASKGHPGPSRIATEVNRSYFGEILQVGHNRVFQKLDSPDAPTES
jgi:hypothetical protein